MAGFMGQGLQSLFEDYLNNSSEDSDGGMASSGPEEDGASDLGADSSECTMRISRDEFQVRALEVMLSGDGAGGETAFVSSEAMDGLEDFLHGSMLDYPTYAECPAVLKASGAVATSWQPASDQGRVCAAYVPLKLEPAISVPVKAPLLAQLAVLRPYLPVISAGCVPGGRSLAEIRERELDRRARVERYRQKRRERAFTKKIRYEWWIPRRPTSST